jgi:ABC-2 type transport system ATP-binding protein
MLLPSFKFLNLLTIGCGLNFATTVESEDLEKTNSENIYNLPSEYLEKVPYTALKGFCYFINHKVLEEIGAIIERPDLYPYLSAQEHLQLFAKLRSKKITSSSIEDTLIKVGLQDRAKDKVQTFSLGMKQRLGIAIALLHNPSLIILDEPTNGLDPQGISDIRNLIKQLAQQEGKTVLVSSHLLSEIEQMATQIMIIHKGKKVADGPIQKLLDPNKMIVHIKTTNDAQTLQIILSGSFSNYLLQRTDGIYLRLPDYEIPLLNASLVNAGVGLIGVETRNSLEDYFLQVTSNTIA